MHALDEALGSQLPSKAAGKGDLPSRFARVIDQTRSITPKLSTMMFAARIGRALTALTSETPGLTDAGILLARGPTTGLVMSNIEAFDDGSDIPFDEVLQLVAIHEYAYRRLLTSVPQLEGDLIRVVERYSASIEADMTATTDVASLVDLPDFSSIDQTPSGGVFELSTSAEQKRTPERFETTLALIEGQTGVVTTQAIAPYLPHVDQLHEVMRRHRASGGLAEQVLSTPIGLRMRPCCARGTARTFILVKAEQGTEAHDVPWLHPDMVLSTAEFDFSDTFLTIHRAALKQNVDTDAALDALLADTIGWAEGPTPEADLEAETLTKAGLASPEDPCARPTEDKTQQEGIEDDADSAQSDDTPQEH